jgi:tRNA A-37 threonylcarbamoyl transferase component Bud32
MHWRLQRLWNDVSNITVLSRKGAPFGSLIVFFKSGGRVAIDLAKLSFDQLEQLVLAFEMRAQQAKKSFEFDLLLDQIHNRKLAQGDVSFTQIWEQDMNRRFSPVAFVPFEPGQTLQDGKLKIIRQLAIGGLSAVYLAQRTSGERVILKESAIPRESNTTLQSKADDMLKRESELLMRLSHPQIVQVQDLFMHNGKAYLVLEYLPGENLRQIVNQNGPISQEQAIEWAKQLCEILEYLHQQKPPIVHRDISPDNIIAGKNGRLVLIDFGAANEFLTTATGTIVGKQAYLPPEQIKGKAVPQSDIYALGATLLFLLTGKDPEPLSQLHAVHTNPGLNPELDQLIYDCTSLALDTRIGSVCEILIRLENIGRVAGIPINHDTKDATVIKCNQKVTQ